MMQILSKRTSHPPIVNKTTDTTSKFRPSPACNATSKRSRRRLKWVIMMTIIVYKHDAVGIFECALLCRHPDVEAMQRKGKIPIFGRPFIKRFALRYRSVVCLSCLSVCLSVTLVYCSQTAEWIKMKRHGGRPWPRPHCVNMGTQLALQKGVQPPIFGPCLLWTNGWLDQDATWY